MTIKVLDQETIQKIAAGEVIHRPSSVVKELVENAIDAGATHIRVEIGDGGKSFIRVSDNGVGILKDEMELSVLPHSTSKLSVFTDLNDLQTMGFRGEALPSIKAVSRLTIMSRTETDAIGQKLVYDQDQCIEKEEVAMNPGTVVVCENIFQHIPVRRKFLKSNLSESNSITDIMYKLAIGNYHVGMLYMKDGRIVFQTQAEDDLKATLSQLFGTDYAENLLEVNLKGEEFSLRGYISNARYYRGNRSMQYLYVNHRYIQDEYLRAQIETCYQGIIPNGRFPAFQLYLSLDASLIDVNIHPNKEQIKFSFNPHVFDEIHEKIYELLREKHAAPELTATKDIKNRRKGVMNLSDYKDHYQNTIDQLVPPKTKSMHIRESSPNYNKGKGPSKPAIQFQFNQTTASSTESKMPYYEQFLNHREEYLANADRREKKEFFDGLQVIGVVFDTYILCQTKDQSKVVFIDQHAAHERIMYEKYCKQFRRRKVDSQLLLSPIILNLKQDDFDIYQKNEQIFEDLGYQIRIFGPQSIAISAVPVVLGYPKGERTVLDIIDSFKSVEKIDAGFIESKIISMSCKSAVKGGNILEKPEINNLLKEMGKAENPYTCPHGRPTIVEMSKYDMEKIFLRNK